MALAQARAGDAHEAGALLELGHAWRADIAHGSAKPARKLVQHGADRPLVRHLAFDAFRHKLHLVLDVLLEIAIRRAARHRSHRAHAAIGLERAALIKKHLAGALFRARKQGADHHAFGAGCNRLGQIARIFNAAVGDHRHAGCTSGVCRLHDRGELGHAHARHDAGGANGARTYADLDRVCARVDQRLGAVAGRDIARDHRHLAGFALDARHLVEHVLRMAMRGVHHHAIHARVDQHHRALKALVADGGGRSHTQAPLLVLAGVGVLD